MSINIEKQPFSESKFFSGTYEENGIEYEFTITQNSDENTGGWSINITWVNDTPDDFEEIEEKIISEFQG